VSQPILSLGIHGATGRMGTRLVQLIAVDPELELVAAIDRNGHPHLGDDAGSLAAVSPLGVPLSSALPSDRKIDVVIDFSLPEGSLAIARVCAERRIPLVVGTTGFAAGQRALLEGHADRVPILIAPNMSRAVNLLMRLVRDAARALAGTADVAIIERHHRTKKDAPSGTALRLAEFARQGQILSGRGDLSHSAPSDISMHSLRVADSPGEHTVVFATMGETVELSHRALNRDGFARGALDAARFLAGKPAGIYSMDDVLGC
jgi:4-hydroxy-tetrahydrodipicolinate reductase